MGSTQSYLSPEAAITVIVVAGAVGLGFTKVGTTTHTAVTSGEGAAQKGKKKKTKVTSGDISAAGSASRTQKSTPEPRVVTFPEVIPGQFDDTLLQTTAESSAPEATVAKSNKSKKKKGKATASDIAPQHVSASVDYLSESSIKVPSRPKNTKRASHNQQSPQPPSSSTAAPSSSPPLARPLHLSTASLDTDGSWTRVASRRNRGAAASDDKNLHSAEPSTSDAGITTSHTGNSSPVAERTEDESFLLQQPRSSASRNSGEENRKTLAEKLLPKPRKTGVDECVFIVYPLNIEGLAYSVSQHVRDSGPSCSVARNACAATSERETRDRILLG